MNWAEHVMLFTLYLYAGFSTIMGVSVVTIIWEDGGVRPYFTELFSCSMRVWEAGITLLMIPSIILGVILYPIGKVLNMRIK